MNSIARIQLTLDYIEDHLSESISLTDLAKIASYSEYHYHRMFQQFVGEPVMSYMRKRRLSRAAEDLISSYKRVIDIAFDYGYQSHETFTRAFRKTFGMMPTECRKRGQCPELFPKASLHALMLYQNQNFGGIIMEARIVELGPLKVTGYAVESTVENGKNREDIPAFWQHYLKNNLAGTIPGKRNEHVELGVCTEFTNDGKFKYVIGYEADEHVQTSSDLVKIEVPAATYAVFTTPKAAPEQFSSSIHQTWDAIFSEWFPHSGYEHAHSPELEWYDHRSLGPDTQQMDIYIPVIKVKE
ncbi:AraC family transcriptional regulator [Paenibacillus sediminis]|uniref:AraC family transcriptional regulator n=1 Tax=Paenibacillus sediminis TaxID=664909 RepID=A0ABS4H677_9BACL|nr:AraC family transcriptional regulator [Paenibacillus sediminis]MBP1938026.1 AraC family transcriptional regulator [Paenibacillus sediminis]